MSRIDPGVTAGNASRPAFGHAARAFIERSGAAPQFACMMRTIITAMLAFAISGCAGNASLHSDAASSRGDDSARIVTTPHTGTRIAGQALAMVGAPYRYGGASPNTGFDCSGLVYYAFQESGISVPRTSREQYRSARKIALRDALEGDILFFEDEEKLSHIGIYLGDGRFVHAPASGRSVSVADLDSAYYQRHLIGVGRLLP